MLRRVYLLFPGRKFAERAVVDLTGMGVARRHIHTIARQDVDIEGLPEASVRQRSDFAARLEQWFWDLNLLLFFAALLVLVAAAFSGSVGVTLAALLVMGLTYLAGRHFVRHLPHAHLDECRTAIRHGEILLLVDLPRERVAAVERSMRKRHPEVEVGGVGWTLDALQI
ncbi:hypothetical protein [Candidatus Endoriftia persephone]|jgi:hypothetical protein|uniref:Uncharacterized protein n=3 Tax=Gammaproteobacteria TaxID=1236 RepID=G2FF24_9GAMM|nr:hypothetical protein [Candidatus Endoriftia persephone]EGW54571.1 hypothetical protein TevJSym_ak00350 [endosymbiont of Tevnia jerichonana (vent Tica)]USF87545.1 hypothetical protein L0Y14_15725 [Candidatus Endoriftia persephone]